MGSISKNYVVGEAGEKVEWEHTDKPVQHSKLESLESVHKEGPSSNFDFSA